MENYLPTYCEVHSVNPLMNLFLTSPNSAAGESGRIRIIAHIRMYKQKKVRDNKGDKVAKR